MIIIREIGYSFTIRVTIVERHSVKLIVTSCQLGYLLFELDTEIM